MVLTFEALVKALALMTGRHEKVLRNSDVRNKKRGLNWVKVIWRSFAVWEREINSIPEGAENEGGVDESHFEEGKPETQSADNSGMSQDNLSPTGAEGVDDDDDEMLTLAALEALDAIEAFESPEVEGKKRELSNRLMMQHAHIPVENIQRIIMLLLLVAPLEPTQSIAMYADRFTGESLISLQVTAENVLRGFTIMCDNGGKGVPWKVFKVVMQQSMVEYYPFVYSRLL